MAGAVRVTPWHRKKIVRLICYGIFVGAAGMWLYLHHGHHVDATLGSILSWRDGARESVYGYGGSH